MRAAVLAYAIPLIDRMGQPAVTVGVLVEVTQQKHTHAHLLQASRTPIDVRAAIGTGIEISRPVIDAAGLRFSVTLPPAPLLVDSDITRLAQVVTNLLNNAAKYTPAGGSFSLHVHQEDEMAVIVVRDSGVGIEPDMLRDISTCSPARLADRAVLRR